MYLQKNFWFILSMVISFQHVLGGIQQQRALEEPIVEKEKVVIGYLSASRNDLPKIMDSIDLDILTHINIAFVNPNSSGDILNKEGELVCSPAKVSGIQEVVKKAHQKGIKVLISLGGGGIPECSGNWETLLEPTNRTMLVNNLVSFAEDLNLDGIDVDIEGALLTAIDQSGNYIPFIKEMRALMAPKGKLVTCATATYDGGRIPVGSIPYFDLVNVMSYDVGWGTNAHHSTYSDAVDHIQKWLAWGCPKEKLVLGVPFYGYFETVGGNSAPYKDLIAQNPDAAYVDEYNGYKYNGIPTMEAKTEYAVQHGAGVMIWELSGDVRGDLSLLKAIGGKISPKH